MNESEWEALDWTDWYDEEQHIVIADDWEIDSYLEDRIAMAIDPRPWDELPTLGDWIGE